MLTLLLSSICCFLLLCAVVAYLPGDAAACLFTVAAVFRLSVAFVRLCAVVSLAVVVSVCVFLMCLCLTFVGLCL